MTRSAIIALAFAMAAPQERVHGLVLPTRKHTTTGALLASHLNHDLEVKNMNKRSNNHWSMDRATFQTTAMATMLAVVLSTSSVAWAADGSSSSFAKQDISGMDFSGQDLSGRDFTGVIARKTNFHNCNLQGSTFYKAILENTDFSGANVRQATFVDATMDGASFKNALAEKAIFSASILDVGDLENVDLTDSLWPSKYNVVKESTEKHRNCPHPFFHFHVHVQANSAS